MNKGLEIGHEMADIAADHAGSYWVGIALKAVINYARKNQYFTTEQVRNANPDLPEPPDKRAWGSVIRLAKKEGYVEPNGWIRAQSLTVHGMVVTLWLSKIYKG